MDGEFGKDIEADICIIAEGSYPYAMGGVSQWIHELLHEHSERTFHILTLVAPNPILDMHYEFPENVVGHSIFIVQDMPRGSASYRTPKGLWDVIHKVLKGMCTSKKFNDYEEAVKFFSEHSGVLETTILSESMSSWEFVMNFYQEMIPNGPFKAFFATVYTMSRSFYSMLLQPLPKAKLFHTVCTGYAGLCTYRAKKELNVPCILTEHGVYTNERRIEIAMSPWIAEVGSLDLDLDGKSTTLKDFWLNAFHSMACACYTSVDEVISTFDGNESIQIEGGADPEHTQTIVHGIKTEKITRPFRELNQVKPVVAFIGRIVPIKDVKTFIRASKLIFEKIPNVEIKLLGPTDEEPEYYKEFLELTERLGLTEKLKFLGRCKLDDYFDSIDLLVMTSISETQPFVIMESGATGIPCVSTNVGGCRPLVEGSDKEDPHLGPGGIITPLVDPVETARAVVKILSDPERYREYSKSMVERIRIHFRSDEQHRKYRELYNQYIGE